MEKLCTPSVEKMVAETRVLQVSVLMCCAGRRTECDYGFMADGDMCVEWTADGVPSAKAVATAASTTANNTVAAKAATSDCGTKNKPICKGADMNGTYPREVHGMIALFCSVSALNI